MPVVPAVLPYVPQTDGAAAMIRGCVHAAIRPSASWEGLHMGRMTGFLAGVIGTALAAAVTFAQAPQQPPAGREGAPAAPGAQTPAGGAEAPAQPAGRGGRGGRGGQATGPQPMSFFVTSVGKGDGGNLGGLAGADAHCAALAKASGLPAATGRTWRAYLSATAANGLPSVNARDRIGVGPWHNAKGVLIANNVADLHGDIERDRNALTKGNALTEKGMPVPGVGDETNQHDMLTGSDSVGRAVAGTMDTTCSNWTSNASAPAATTDSRGGGGGGAATGGRGTTAADSGTAAPGGGTAVAGEAARPRAEAARPGGEGRPRVDKRFGAPVPISAIPTVKAAPTRRGTTRTAHAGAARRISVATGGAGLFYCFAAN